MKLGLYGVGGLGAEVLELSRRCNETSARYSEIFFIDDDKNAHANDSLRMLSFEQVIAVEKPTEVEIAVCVGEPRVRSALAEKVRKAGFRFATLIHPEVEVPKSARIGEGVIVYRYCNIGPNASIGSNTALLLGANVPHDNSIGENCVISTNAILSGACTVGDGAYVAAGAVVKEGVSIGDWAIVGLGSVIFKDIEAESITIGNPSKVVGKNETHTVFNR